MPTQPYLANGKRIPGVTTILGRFKDSGGLIKWANNVAIDVLDEAIAHCLHLTLELEQVDENITQGKATWPSKKTIEDSRVFLKSDPRKRADCYNKSKKEADAGTVAHHLVEDFIHGENPLKTTRDVQDRYEVSEEVANRALQAYNSFEQWVHQTRFQFLYTEVPLVSENYLYGGTLDAIGYFAGEWCLFDWKASNHVYLDYLLQLAAYRLLWYENWEPEIKTAHLVKFSKDNGNFRHYWFDEATLDKAEDMFLLLREAYEYDKELKGVVK